MRPVFVSLRPFPHVQAVVQDGTGQVGTRQDDRTVTKSVTIRLLEIAELLSVTKQRAHQIAGDPAFPAPVAEDVRGRLWDRREVERWAEVWRAEKPWR
jgi:hypothetical protein